MASAQFQVAQLPPQSNSGTLSSPLKDCPHSPQLTPALSSHRAAFSIRLWVLDISHKWSHTVFALLYLAPCTQFTQTIIWIRITFPFHQLMDIQADSCFSPASSTSAAVSCLLITAVLMDVKSLIAFDLHFSQDAECIGIYLNRHLHIFFGEVSVNALC